LRYLATELHRHLTMAFTFAQNLIQDFRQGIHSIKRSKAIALGVVISMGLGLGATASMFSVVDFFVYRPLPVPETGRVVRIGNSTPDRTVTSLSYPEYQDYVERSQSFTGITTYETPLVSFAPNLTDQPHATVGMPVSGNAFSMLEVTPALGRGFLPEEDSVPGRDAVAVISYKVWQRDFAGRADVIGREVAINGHPLKIVGVAPEWFHGLEHFVQPEIYFPRMMVQSVLMTSLTDRTNRTVRLFARLKPGVSIEQANDEIGRIAGQLALEHPETNKETKAVVLSQYAYRVKDDPRLLRIAVLFLTLGFLVLGVASVNVSNLLLSTVPARTRDMAVRVAMGAPRVRLLRQLLLESAILSAGGSVAGLFVASWWAALFRSIRLGLEAAPLQAEVDERVVIFTVGVGLVSALAAGAIPAWRCSRSDLNSLLKSSDPRSQPHKTWGRQLLVGVQVAVASVLLVMSGFVLKGLQIAATQNPGFRVDHILTMEFDPAIAGYSVERTRIFYAELIERLRAVPGIRSAAIAQNMPFGGINSGSTRLTIDGYPLPPNQAFISVRSAFVGNGYFETLDIPVIRGRAFDRRDAANAPKTVIVNEAMAQQYWPNRDPVGSRVEFTGDGGPAEVIGVARNAKYGGLDERPLPFLYRSYDQSGETYAALFVETEGNPETLTATIRTELRNMAPNVPIFDVRTMQNHIQENGLTEPKMGARMFTPLSAVAMVLGVLGLYGVIAYSVSQRTYEIGIRIAVGASDRQMMRMVLLQGLRSSGIASTAGVGFTLAMRGVTEGMFDPVTTNDLTIYFGVLLLMLVATGAACYIPARRAARIDPNITLRT
jgi:predicted permease